MTDTKSQDSLRDLLQEQFVEALNSKFSTIYQGLLESETGKSSFGVTFKLTLVKGRAFSDCDLHGAEKWSAQVEGNVKLFEPDPTQEKLGLTDTAKEFVKNLREGMGKGGSCTIKTGGKSVTISGKEEQ